MDITHFDIYRARLSNERQSNEQIMKNVWLLGIDSTVAPTQNIRIMQLINFLT